MNRMALIKRFKTLFITIVVVFSACASGPQYYYSDVELGETPTIALLPPVNLSKNEEAGDIVSRSLLVQILETGKFDVIDPGEVDAVVLKKRIRFTDRLPLSAMQEIGSELGARYLLLGSVNEFEMVTDRVSTIPVVSLSLRIVESDTGDIFWAATHTKRGDDSESIFGIGRIESLERLTAVVVEEIAESLKR